MASITRLHVYREEMMKPQLVATAEPAPTEEPVFTAYEYEMLMRAARHYFHTCNKKEEDETAKERRRRHLNTATLNSAICKLRKYFYQSYD